MSNNLSWNYLNSVENSSLAHQVCFEAVFSKQTDPTTSAIGNCMQYVLKTVRNYQQFPTVASLQAGAEDGASAGDE